MRISVVLPEPGEISQPEASARLAAALAGPGVQAEPPHQGQVVLRTGGAGLLRVAGRQVVRFNRVGAALLATSLDGRVVDAGETVGIVKAARLWNAAEALRRAEEVVAGAPVLRVAPFVVRDAAFLAGQRIRTTNFEAAAGNLRKTLGRFGSGLIAARQVPDEPPAIAAAIGQAIDEGAEVVLVAGSIVLDPGDPFLVALDALRGRIVCRGAPVDPGTMFWVAYVRHHGRRAVCFGLASCEMYGRLSVLDLILPYALAREPITPGLFAELGYGGLLQQTFAARQSEIEPADEEASNSGA
jgi:hypothetical protein